MDYATIFPTAKLEELNLLIKKKKDWINQNKKGFLRYQLPFATVRHIRADSCDFKKDTVIIGSKEDISPQEHEQIFKVMQGI